MPDIEQLIRESLLEIANEYDPSAGFSDRIDQAVRSSDARSTRGGRLSLEGEKRPRRRAPAIAWALSILILVGAITFVTIGTGSRGAQQKSGGSPGNHSTTNKPEPPRQVSTPRQVPGSCTTRPVLTPQAPTPTTWPTNFQILNTLPGVLAAQYPTVFDSSGLAGPDNSQYFVDERVHDHYLESEVRQAGSGTHPPLDLSFVIVPYSLACLKDVQTEVESSMPAASRAGIKIFGVGLQIDDVIVNISNCGTSAAEATSWFKARWASIVSLATCQSMPTAGLQVART